MFGDRIRRRSHGDDSPYATQLLAYGLPTVCPVCGSFTRPVDTEIGWLCTHPACTFSTDPTLNADVS